MNFMKHFSPKMVKDYEYVEDQKDLRIPVQSEEAFACGVQFKAKYIGTQEVSRPSTRVEIVAAMRRIRYEFKYRNIKKRKVFLDVSVSGIRISLRKKQKKHATPSDVAHDDCSLFIMHYPINRVFYVSHDSQDLKIFSFIARSDDGTFKCSVFKAIRKSAAMNTVRTIGQAFEVCHKLNTGKDGGSEKSQKDGKVGSSPVTPSKKVSSDIDDEGETDIDDLGETDIDDVKSSILDAVALSPKSTVVTDIDKVKESPPQAAKYPTLPQYAITSNGEAGTGKFPVANMQQVQGLYHQQLMHQIHETEVTRSELTLVKEQLRAESASRVDAQGRVHRLLAQNRELITTIQKLMGQLQEKHCKENGEPMDETWVLDPGLTSRNVAMTTASLTNSSSSPRHDNGSSLIDFESSVFDNVYQFANFDAKSIPPPISGDGAAGFTPKPFVERLATTHAPQSTNGGSPNKARAHNSAAASVTYSPLRSIYSSESDEVSDSSWREDSQDEDAVSSGLSLVTSNMSHDSAAPFQIRTPTKRQWTPASNP